MALHADTYQRVLCQIPNAEVSTLVPAQLPGKNQAQICKDSLSRVLYCLGSLIIQDVYWSTHICYKSSTAHSRPVAAVANTRYRPFRLAWMRAFEFVDTGLGYGSSHDLKLPPDRLSLFPQPRRVPSHFYRQALR